MPRRDGTGPMGFGERTGRGLGFCTGSNEVNHRPAFGMGLGRGFVRRFGYGCGLGRNFVLNKKFRYMHKRLFQHQFESFNK